MDSRTTSTTGLGSSRGSRLFGRVACSVTALGVALGFAAWIADYDPTEWLQTSASANVSAASIPTTSFDDRFGSGSARSSRVMNYPWRTASRPARTDFDAEFGHIEGQLGGQPRASEPIQAEQPASSAEAPAVPMPRSRPVAAGLALNIDPQPAATSDERTLFDKLADIKLGNLMPMKFTLASLTPNDGLFSEKKDLSALGYDSQTAVYDISARAVYMPNGVKLEAHSGLGSLMDNPAYVDRRMVGATPPNIYDLKPREKLFHGVAALRMTPVGENEMHGRNGLLVHSYLLGPNGDSNGCVSIKEYDRFLAAYHNGEVKRLVVVPSLKEGLTASRRSPSPS
jgi:hypothetical protein